MTLKDFLIENVSADKYYKDRFTDWDFRARPNVNCPFHEDSTPSLSVGLKNGGAKCHGCNKAIGNIVHFESELTGLNEYQASVKLYDEYIHKLVSEEKIESFEQAVTKAIQTIQKDTGLTSSTVKRFRLGFDIRSGRITIPVVCRFGLFVNIRYYRLPSQRSGTAVKIYNEEGHGCAEFFPWKQFRKYDPSKPLFWMKAERDTMLAIQEGLQAFCITSGEYTFDESVFEIFKDFKIAIVGDNDEQGIKAADDKLNRFKSHEHEAEIITLPFKQSKPGPAKDFSDWIIGKHGTANILDLLARKALHFEGTQRTISGTNGTANQNGTLPDFYSKEFLHLIDLGRRSEMLNRRVKVRGIVSGKLDQTFTVPYKFNVSSKSMPKRIYTVPIGRELLELVGRSDETVICFIRKLLRAPKAIIEPLEHISISQLEVIPLVTPEFESPYTTQKCFFVGEDIQSNVPYEMEIIPTNQIRSQETVGLIVRAVPISSSITNVSLDQATLDSLNSFRSEGGETPFNSIKTLANDFSLQYSQIYNRIDWHVVALLSWASPLQFEFPNEGLQRGWINTLALGDTQTGKSEVVEAIQKVTNSGVFINAENCTYVGLVGGAIKNGSGQFMLRWGKIPINNRQLVVVEELSGLSIEEISNLSEVRSSGIARLDKGGLSSETFARTRLICLSNVRGRGKTLAGYISGVKAVSDLIGHGEDISRFDFIITLTDREVSPEVINRPRYARIDCFDEEDFRNLIRFIWSLKPEQIQITKAAYLACLRSTEKLARIYHPSIPLFKAGSGRLKIARIAVALACFQFNWNGEQIIVTPEHIESTVELLESLYDKASCGYREYSEQMFYRESIASETDLKQQILIVLNTHDKRERTFRYIVHAAKFTADELSQIAGIQIHQAGTLVGRMVASNILRKGDANVWEVTPIGKHWIQEQMNNPTPSELPTASSTVKKAKPVKGSLVSLFNNAKSK